MISKSRLIAWIASHDVADVREHGKSIRVASHATIREPGDSEHRLLSAIDFVEDYQGARNLLGY